MIILIQGVEEKAVVEKETQEKTEDEKPTNKKAKMAKANTMAVTAKVSIYSVFYCLIVLNVF